MKTTNWATTSTKMKRKKSNELPRGAARHLFPAKGHLSKWTLIPIAVLLLILFGWHAQASANFPNPDKKKQPGAEFLLFGTVFTQQGFALPGAEISVRRVGEKPEKKPRWRASSDRRGEFAVNVPAGAEYEVTVRAPGYKDESRKVDARQGGREDMIFRMQPAPKK